nr:hypothetical protein [Tanacetum cinerariifolium]
MLRDNALVELRKKFETAKKERDELKLTLDKFQTSSKNLSKLLESQVSDKTSLGYDSQVFNSQVHSYESDASVLTSPLVRVTNVVYVESSSNKPSKDMSKTLRPDALIIEDWTSDSEDEYEIEFVPKQKEPTFVPISEHVKTPKETLKKVKHPKQAKTLRQTIKSLEGTEGNADKALANWVWKPKYTVLDHVSRLTSSSMTLKKFNYTDALGRSNGCSRHMTGNISFLLDFKEFNGGYVAFGGNPKGGKISGKVKLRQAN